MDGKYKEIENYLNSTEVLTLRDKWLIELLNENKKLSLNIKQWENFARIKGRIK